MIKIRTFKCIKIRQAESGSTWIPLTSLKWRNPMFIQLLNVRTRSVRQMSVAKANRLSLWSRKPSNHSSVRWRDWAQGHTESWDSIHKQAVGDYAIPDIADDCWISVQFNFGIWSVARLNITIPIMLLGQLFEKKCPWNVISSVNTVLPSQYLWEPCYTTNWQQFNIIIWEMLEIFTVCGERNYCPLSVERANISAWWPFVRIHWWEVIDCLWRSYNYLSDFFIFSIICVITISQ